MSYRSKNSNIRRDAYKITNRRLSRQSNNSESKGFIDTAKNLTGLISWQILVVLILVIFYKPISRMVEVLPSKFEKSSEISVGSLSFKIQEQAQRSGNAELAGIIQGLSEKAIKKLLQLGSSSYSLMGNNGSFRENNQEFEYYPAPDLPEYKELVAKGLATSKEDISEFEKWINSLMVDGKIKADTLTNEQKRRLTDNNVQISDQGKRAYEIIIKVIADSIAN